MHDTYKELDVFEFSAEAQIIKLKLENEGITTMLMDEKIIDSDPLITKAIGGVKLMVHQSNFKQATIIYRRIRQYAKDDNDLYYNCPNCNSQKILIAPLQRKNIFYMLFPFFEKTRKQCMVCNTIF